MRKLSVFNQVSIDGYFRTPSGDIGWVHQQREDPEFKDFIAGNASGGGVLLFGRKTYEMMASFWPMPAAAQQFPVVARQMNALPKVVFSRTLANATWSNTTIVNGDLVAEVRKLKSAAGEQLAILGSGSIVAQLARAGLIDEYQIVIFPVVLGDGVSMFAGVGKTLDLRLKSARTFKNGIEFLVYEPA